MATTIAQTLASIARPALLGAAALTTPGALAASAGLGAGWYVYLVGFAAAAVAIPATWAVYRGRIGRPGQAAFAFLSAALVLGVPVIAMVAGYVNLNVALHDAFMPYAMTPFGMFGLYGTLVGIVLVGVVIARSGLVPPRAGVLIAAAPFIDLPVELGLLPLPVWGVAVVVLAAGFVLVARALPATAVPSTSLSPA